MLSAWLVLAAGAARADLGFRPEDTVALTEVDRRLLAVVGASLAPVVLQLELGEDVIALRAQGLVGVAATSRRLLAIHGRVAAFTELRYRISEKPPDPDLVHVADRLVLVALPARLAAFSADAGSWQELSLGPGEKPLDIRMQGNVAAAITPRRAIGFSPRSGGFVEFPLTPTEVVERSTLSDDSITLILPNRVIVLQAGDKQWRSLNR